MSKVCQITGKKAMVGNNVSHSKRRTKRKFDVNLFNKKGLDAAIKEAAAKGYITEIKYLDIL